MIASSQANMKTDWVSTFNLHMKHHQDSSIQILEINIQHQLQKKKKSYAQAAESFSSDPLLCEFKTNSIAELRSFWLA